MDHYPCTKEHPLYMDFDAVAYAFLIVDGAARLLNETLNKQPIAETARKLAADLWELQGKLVGAGLDDSLFYPYAEALLEVRFTHVEVITGDDKKLRLRLWRQET